MYFIVYIPKLNKHEIVPYKWIKGIDDQFGKFVNSSLNRSQNFLCYYTSKDDAFENGRPKNFVPDFATIVDQIEPDGSFDGCFLVKLKYYKSKLILLSQMNIGEN